MLNLAVKGIKINNKKIHTTAIRAVLMSDLLTLNA